MATQAMPDRPLIGVLALQGAFRDHVQALEAAGARARLVRLPQRTEIGLAKKSRG